MDTETQPQFKPGDRFFTHYDMQWGTVVEASTTYRGQKHGVTGTPLPDTTWYEVKYDNGSTSNLDDAHGNWDMARMMPPHIAKRHGYGDDPNPPKPEPEPAEYPCDYCRGFAFKRTPGTTCPRCGPADNHRIEPVNALAKLKRIA